MGLKLVKRNYISREVGTKRKGRSNRQVGGQADKYRERAGVGVVRSGVEKEEKKCRYT